MRTREEYLKLHVRCKDFFPAEGRTMIDEVGALEAMKDMQQDHDKEFEDFVAWWYKDNPLVDEAKRLKMINEFRNHKP